MKHRITMIGTDGSKVYTRQEEDLYSGNDMRDKLFMEDIFLTEWFQRQNIPYHPQRPFQAQLPELTTTGDIVILDTSYQDRSGNIHTGLQIVTPPIENITNSQKEILKDDYPKLTEEPIEHVMVDCIKDPKNFLMDSFNNLDSFYEALDIKEYGRHR